MDMPDNYHREYVRFGLASLHGQMKLPYLNVFSKSLAKRLVNLGFSGHIDIIPFPLHFPYGPNESKNELRKEFGLPIDKKIVLSVSSSEKRKNLPRVKEALEILGEDFLLLRVGPSIGIGKAYRNIDYETLNKLYNLSDALVLPSLLEGYGIPVTEALACQLPIVVSRLDVFEEVARDQAVYIDPMNSHDIARGIKEAVESFRVDPKFSTEIRKMHSRDNFRSEILKHYEKVLNET
jgi:glycosyltransferase involved in cell wall biosynthesis